MKKVISILLLSILVYSSWAQELNPLSTDAVIKRVEESTLLREGKKNNLRSSESCTDFIFYQDLGLNSNTNQLSAFTISTLPDGPSISGFEDFTLTSAETINAVVLGISSSKCNPQDFEITFRADNNGAPGAVLATSLVSADAITYTKQWTTSFWVTLSDQFNAHIPITPIDLGPGTYWLEVTCIVTSFSVLWLRVHEFTGAPAARASNGVIFTTGGGYAFALAGPDSSPAPACDPPYLEAFCKNATVALQTGGQVNISASDVDCGSIAYTSIVASPSTFDCSDIGAHNVVLTVMDDDGNSDECTATVTVTNDANVPNGWNATDIGMATMGNEYNFDPCDPAGDQYTVTGSDNNTISTTADNIAFASQMICGDGSISAKIESVEASGYGGIMIRETTASGSKQVAVFSNMTNLLRHESRTINNAPKTIQSFFKPSPIWLRIRRVGNWVHVEYSSNGMMFLPVQSTYVVMGDCVEIGLASFTYLPFSQTSAIFSNVVTTGNPTNLVDNAPTAFDIDLAQEVNTQEYVKENNIQLYPNPTSTNLILQLEAPLEQISIVEVFNLYGQSIAQQQLLPGQVQQEWQTTNWPEGTYVLKILRNGQAPLNKQFVVIK